MRRLLGPAALAAAGLTATLTAAPAGAAVPMPGPGTTCSLTSDNAPFGGNAQTGHVEAGPLDIADDTDPTVVHTGNVVCTIQVDFATHQAPGAASPASNDLLRVPGPVTAGVVALPATPVSYPAAVTDYVYLCTEVVVDGRHFYWSDEDTPTTRLDGWWSTDPETASCALAISTSTGFFSPPGRVEP